jgi:hypothetical protein
MLFILILNLNNYYIQNKIKINLRFIIFIIKYFYFLIFLHPIPIHELEKNN